MAAPGWFHWFGAVSGAPQAPAGSRAQVDLMLQTARAAGRDPAALEYTRWGAIDMTADEVAAHAANGATRLVVGPSSAEESEQMDQISALAARLALSP